jgi:hypothetical protein
LRVIARAGRRLIRRSLTEVGEGVESGLVRARTRLWPMARWRKPARWASRVFAAGALEGGLDGAMGSAARVDEVVGV